MNWNKLGKISILSLLVNGGLYRWSGSGLGLAGGLLSFGLLLVSMHKLR